MSLSPLVWQNALLTFIISILLGATLSFIVILPFAFSLLFLLAMVGVGIVFDAIGVAVAAADEKPLHAMGADKIAGSGQAIWLVRRTERVANVCNDVVGDVSGTVSGAITVSLAAALAVRFRMDGSLLSVLSIAVVAALTVGGKAFGKVYALRSPHVVVLAVGRGLSWLGWPGLGQRRRAVRRKERRDQGRR